jgi:hypothetical protein
MLTKKQVEIAIKVSHQTGIEPAIDDYYRAGQEVPKGHVLGLKFEGSDWLWIGPEGGTWLGEGNAGDDVPYTPLDKAISQIRLGLQKAA